MRFTIQEVDTTQRRQVNDFVRLPFKLYAGNPHWVPPFLSEARRQLDQARHPFYEHNEAAFFLARGRGETVGRICAIHPRLDNQATGRQDAYFYLFECIDEQPVADALYDAAAAWARGRGLAALRGPLGFMAGDGFGILADGFEHSPALGIPYNHPYYPALAEGWGFELEERYFSGYMDADYLRANFPEKILRVAERTKTRYGFQIKAFGSKRELRRWVAPRLGELYERAFTHVSRDRHLTREQVDAIARRMLLVSDPRLLKFVTRDDEIVGFLFVFLNISNGLRRAGGRLFPFGWMHVLLDLRRTDTADFNGIGLLPEYQGLGGTALLYAEIYRALKPVEHIKHAEAIQIAESNTRSLNEGRMFGLDFYKTHHIYRKAL